MKTASGAREAFETSSSNLDLGVVDLYLIHAPWPWGDIGSDHRDGNVEVWKVFEELYDAGRTRSIGVSNFAVADLEDLLGRTDVVPHANQIRWFIGNTQDETTAFDRAHDILTEATRRSPPGVCSRTRRSGTSRRSTTRASRRSRSATCSSGTCCRCRSRRRPSRIAENADVDFVLSAEDVAALDALQDTTD